MNMKDNGDDEFDTTTTTTTTRLKVLKEKDYGSEELVERQLNKQSQQQHILNSTKKCKDDFEFIRTIGKGSYGKVKLVVENSTGYLYAAKILNKQLIIKEKKAKYVNTEKTILDSLDHPNIVKLYYTFQDERNLYFIIEYCPNGDLLEQLKKCGCFQMEVVKFYAAEILLTLEYLHSKSIVHRDLKPENILLSKTMRTKLSDFGTAKTLSGSLERSGSFCGTAEFVCPELLIEKSAGKMADIWSYGCLLYQLVSGKLPFKGFNEYQTFQLIIKRDFEYPDSFDPIARTLVDRILTINPNERPSFEEIKSHPFFNGVDWSTLNQMDPPQITIDEPVSPLPSPTSEERKQRSQSIGSPNIHQQQMNKQLQQQRERSTTTTSSNNLMVPPPLSTSSPLVNSNTTRRMSGTASPNLSTSQVLLRFSDLPKSFQSKIYITPTDLLIQGKGKIAQFREEQRDLLWNRLLLPNEEIILAMVPVEKRTGLMSKKRQLIITNSPRIFWVDSSKMIVKGEITIDLTLSASSKSKKHFTITSRGRTRHFYDIVSQDSQRLVELINQLKLLGSF